MGKTITAVAAVPLALFGLLVVVAGGAHHTNTTATGSACAYSTPDAGRIVTVMEQLTTSPVDADRWARYATQIGANPSPTGWETSTSEQRHQLLTHTITTLLHTEAPHALTTPVIVWWAGTLPHNDDTTWTTLPLPGWTGTLASYLTELAHRYPTTSPEPAVRSSGCDAPCVQPAVNPLTVVDDERHRGDGYATVATEHGVAANVCPTGAAAVIVWADTQIGAPYATINPWRFGTPPWDGGTHTGLTGRTYSFPAGTIVYDCSGFVITAWRQAGIDYPGQYGIYTSDGFLDPRIPDTSPTELQPGDLAIYDHDAAGNGHIVMIHHVDRDGTVNTIEASGSRGVHIGHLDWSRVIGLKHPTS